MLASRRRVQRALETPRPRIKSGAGSSRRCSRTSSGGGSRQLCQVLLEHFSAKWIRFAVQKCSIAKKRADSVKTETALVELKLEGWGSGEENWGRGRALYRRSRMTRIHALSSAVAFASLVALTSAAIAQSSHSHQQPYAGLETRAVKSLSDQQIDDLRAGRGMGLALPAELNGYPGPVHVLDHADALKLTPAQREHIQGLLQSMKAETIPLGERLIEQETELNRLFARKIAQPSTLEALTASIGATQGALRAAHLRYHLAMLELLTPEQTRRYAELRGYAIHHGPGEHGRPHAR